MTRDQPISHPASPASELAKSADQVEDDDARQATDASRSADTAPADVAEDEVDEASWESFPASDAPAWRQHP